ncbi:MAG: UDP-2,3-diacylglucosamine diphosphatase [Pseudomonadota bacterium]
MKTFLLSDLHLTPERPATIEEFTRFLTTEAPQAETIYLLGDLFEYWIGDDAASLLGAKQVLAAMKQASQQANCYFIAGNRDFLVGESFTAKSGFKILPDETVVDLYGTPTLLLHGDSLCTDDTAHQEFRQQIVTNTAWHKKFLGLSIPERIEQAKQARAMSHEHKAQISMEIMDVTEQTVKNSFVEYDVTQMIHGHTHRQATHEYSINGKPCYRYVLGDWAATSSIMTATAEGLTIANQPIASGHSRKYLFLLSFWARYQTIKLFAFLDKAKLAARAFFQRLSSFF